MSESGDTVEAPIEDADQVSRFIHHSDWFLKANGKPKTSAFLPVFYERLARWETSLCHHAQGCTNERVWHLARTTRPDRRLYGRVDFEARLARINQLECLTSPDGDFVEHAVLVAWPSDKQRQKELAFDLAKACPPMREPPAVQVFQGAEGGSPIEGADPEPQP